MKSLILFRKGKFKIDKTILVFLVITAVSCSEYQSNKVVAARRDSLVDYYFKMVDSISGVDTLDTYTRMFLAYTKNDTNVMQAIIRDLESVYSEEREHFQTKRELEPPEITSYGFDEAFRFQYSATFCDQSVNITIGRRGDSVLLYAYQYTWKYGTDSCISIDSLKTVLSKEDSQGFAEGLIKTDLWGLTPRNGEGGFDGSNLFVTGYEKGINARPSRYTTIYRWSPQKTALGELFNIALSLAKYQIPCFHR